VTARTLFSFARWWSIVLKEFRQLRRDRVTFAMIVGVPIIQLTLFGFAINTNPKHLPTAVIMGDESPFSRSFVIAMKSSDYFDIVETLPNEKPAAAHSPKAACSSCFPCRWISRGVCCVANTRRCWSKPMRPIPPRPAPPSQRSPALCSQWQTKISPDRSRI
jgi:hypothetical protein